MMTATQNAKTTVAPRNMEEAYVMLYGNIGEIRYSNYIVFLEKSATDNSKQKTN